MKACSQILKVALSQNLALALTGAMARIGRTLANLDVDSICFGGFLRYNPHNIKLTILKHTFVVVFMLWNQQNHLIPKLSSPQEETPYL